MQIAILLSLGEEEDTDQLREEELEISAEMEERCGELSVQLFRAEAKNRVRTHKITELSEAAERWRQQAAKVQESNKSLVTTSTNLASLVREIIEHMDSGRLPFRHFIEAALSAAQQPSVSGPFLVPQKTCHELKRGVAAISRLDLVEDMHRNGYNARNSFYQDKFIPAAAVIEFLSLLVNLEATVDTRAGLEVMFAHAKPMPNAEQSESHRSAKAAGKRKKAKAKS